MLRIAELTDSELIDEFHFYSRHTDKYEYALLLYNEIVYRGLEHYYEFISEVSDSIAAD